ncbi:XRE family transcriptional regulator [Roseovarius sp. TE539]|uniref:helix-turn-helix domain-containing protein n=1 Tax=Roseovarius sp. TE539 TaxID=2249812 RepID=UPI000DDCA63A|nr:helix-turn-helix transcriptional regulator [Roseovarius sp. TE539]RBI73070.1 XRE family transcriptional regulator [Roseovarius sp. TE539]
MTSDFSANLNLLCSYQRSIAEVCRRLRFNRQQFNRYLNGQSRPSRHNMRRICDHFGVTEAEILLDHNQFEQMIALRRRPVERTELERPLHHLERIYRSSQEMHKYTGFYFRYFFSFGNKGMIFRSLASVHHAEGKYYWKNIEILRDGAGRRMTGLNKYEGVVFFLADRLYIMEYETLEVNTITQMTLYPSYQHRLDCLFGIQTGGPTRRGRKPGASRVALEYLGRNIDVRQALRQTGLFDPAEGNIRSDLVSAITNSIEPGEHVLEIDEP